MLWKHWRIKKNKTLSLIEPSCSSGPDNMFNQCWTHPDQNAIHYQTLEVTLYLGFKHGHRPGGQLMIEKWYHLLQCSLRKLTPKTRRGSLHLDHVGYRFPLRIMTFYVCNIWGDVWCRLICLLTVAHFHCHCQGSRTAAGERRGALDSRFAGAGLSFQQLTYLQPHSLLNIYDVRVVFYDLF